MYKLLLCLRYLKTRYIALACIISVMLGVATMIVVNSVMAGFATEMRQRIHGILADVVVETTSMDGVQDAELHMQRVREVAGEYIAGMTGTVEVYGVLSFEVGGKYAHQPVTLIGIKPEGKSQVGPLVDYLDSYNPVLEGDKVVRRAVRSRDEPPGWELTPEAMKYREEWTLRQRWLLDRAQHAHNPPSEDRPEAPPFADAPPFQQAPPGLFDDLEAPDSSESLAADHEFPVEAPKPGVVRGTQPAHDPFAAFPAPEEHSPSVDESDPLPARLYVGIGLVSYAYEDPQTGQTRTHMTVRPGDDVIVSTIRTGQPEPVRFHATVVDLFKSGMSEYDSSLVFCNLEELQRARGMIDPTTGRGAITSIQIKLRNFDDAPEVVRRLEAAFPPGRFWVRTWEDKQGPLLAAVEVESAILNVLLFLIIAVAGFGILAIFFMIVVEKTRDIGILKALGASSGGVMSIFLSYGLALGIVGSGVGVVIGLLFVHYINVIESWITWLTGQKVFDQRIYYFPEIPTAVHPAMVVWVAAGAIAIAVLASVLPARRASRLRPVEALRYE